MTIDIMKEMSNVLYKYRTYEDGIEIIDTGKVYFPTPSQFNDLYEGTIAFNSDDPEARKNIAQQLYKQFKKNPEIYDYQRYDNITIEEFRDKIERDKEFAETKVKGIEESLRNTLGVFCFSGVKGSMPMWAYYADDHEGCCIEFDFTNHRRNINTPHILSLNRKECFPFDVIVKVDYTEDYTKTTNVVLFPFEEGFPCITKHNSWKHEEERRTIMLDHSGPKKIWGDIKNIDERMKGGGRLYDVDDGVISRVICGINMCPDKKEKLQKACLNKNIPVYNAKRDPHKYGIKEEWVNPATIGGKLLDFK